MNTIKCIIIEDEVTSQNLLQNLLQDYCPQVDILGIASSVVEAFTLCQHLRPDLIFMDINLGQEETGFDFLDLLHSMDFYLVVTSAHDCYALKAFEHQVIDYLLKPLSPKSVARVINRVDELMEQKRSFQWFEDKKNETQKEALHAKVALPIGHGYQVMSQSDIIRAESCGSYVSVHATDGNTYLISSTLKGIQESLDQTHFFRIHDSHLINTSLICQYLTNDGGTVILVNGDQVPVSRRKKKEILSILQVN